MDGKLFINGQWTQGQGTEFSSLDPATGADVWQGGSAHATDVHHAVAAAAQAFIGWSARSLEERLQFIKTFQTVIAQRKDALANLISREMGKPLWDAKTEVSAVQSKVDISMQAYHARTGETSRETDGIFQQIQHRPLGVMAVFGPYNFPAHLPNGHIIPALLAGNTVVFKPSEQTPAVGEFYTQCWQDAGLPDGVMNLVQGARETGVALVEHPQLAGVLFTGSYATGQAIHRALAGRPEVQLALEMGGNNALIVWDVADAHAAARLVVLSAFLTSGQRCTCARRLILPLGDTGDALIHEIITLVKRLRIDAWNVAPEPFMGPLVNAAQARAVLTAQSDLSAMGAVLLLEAAPLPGKPETFISPSVIDITSLRNVSDHEVFGPLLQIQRVENFAEALQQANATAYGLSAGLISDDAQLWEKFRSSIRAGIVNWNRPLTGASSAAPFGGPGKSGNLRPSAYYAADYCAYPMATLASAHIHAAEPIMGLNERLS
ncbi:MAG: succinylglutamate-semialdehyde dehydrogenase [Rickettsiales bacterium]|nr:succinylglutamate-semialdehyde dehydrogenase [Rickettsiales bacterium]